MSSRQIQFIRGNTQCINHYTGPLGSFAINTDDWSIHIQDGVTPGGHIVTGTGGGGTNYSNANVHAYLTSFDGNILPSANVTYSLGSITHQWKDLFVSNNTIYLNGIPLSINSYGNLTINGQEIAQGPQGIQGNVGPQGPQGIQGNVGPQGPQGIQGIQGNIGLQGSIGPQGIQGNVGPQGPQGVQGIQGNIGETGPRGFTGNVGEQGPQGDPGLRGNTGAQGVSVTLLGSVDIVANLPMTGNAGEGWIVQGDGNLYIWNSTTIHWDDIGQIVGPQGDPGPQGPRGFTGNVGPQGPQGDTGPAGPQGIQGIQGNVGPQGPQGIQGNVGPQGDAGPQGVQGIQGNTGPQGVQGIQGNTGPQGASGTALAGWTINTFNSLVPDTDILQDIGTLTNRVRHIYVGPGSINIGDSVLSESTTGKLVVPGLTRATSLHADEVEDTGDQTTSWGSVPQIIDYYEWSIIMGNTPDSSYVAAEYSANGLDGEGFIDGINVDVSGTWTQAIADANKTHSMYAYNGSGWVSIPFCVRAKADDVEYEFSQGSTITVGVVDSEGSLTNDTAVTAIGFSQADGFSVTELDGGIMKVSFSGGGATGPQGPQGIQGNVGPQGPQGPAGADGTGSTSDAMPPTINLDGGAASVVYEYSEQYAEGGGASTRFGVYSPIFDGENITPNTIDFNLNGGGA